MPLLFHSKSRKFSSSVCAASLPSSAIPSLAQVLTVSSLSLPTIHLTFLLSPPLGTKQNLLHLPCLPQGRSRCHSCYWQPSITGWEFKTSGQRPEDQRWSPEGPTLEPILAMELQNRETQVLCKPIQVRFLSLVSKDMLTDSLVSVHWMTASQALLAEEGRKRNPTFLSEYFLFPLPIT